MIDPAVVRHPGRPACAASSPIRQVDDDACFARTTWASEGDRDRDDAAAAAAAGDVCGIDHVRPGRGEGTAAIASSNKLHAALPCAMNAR